MLLTVVSYVNADKNLGIFKLTEPEFSVQIPKPSAVVSPVTVEINAAVLSSLKHLQLHPNHHHHHQKHRSCKRLHRNNVTLTYETRSSADADNRLDAFSSQSRSTNMVSFHMLHMVSYCVIVTLSLRRAVFTIFVFKKFHDLEMGSKVTQGH